MCSTNVVILYCAHKINIVHILSDSLNYEIQEFSLVLATIGTLTTASAAAISCLLISLKQFYFWQIKAYQFLKCICFIFSLVSYVHNPTSQVLTTKQVGNWKDVSNQKSNNLQYNTLVQWADGTNDSSTKILTFQVFFFFINSYRLRALKTLYFYFCKYIKK